MYFVSPVLRIEQNLCDTTEASSLVETSQVLAAARPRNVTARRRPVSAAAFDRRIRVKNGLGVKKLRRCCLSLRFQLRKKGFGDGVVAQRLLSAGSEEADFGSGRMGCSSNNGPFSWVEVCRGGRVTVRALYRHCDNKRRCSWLDQVAGSVGARRVTEGETNDTPRPLNADLET